VTGLHRSWLYAPGDRPELLAKSLRSAADAVVFDLEDAVAADRKSTARKAVAEMLACRPPKPVYVRINAVDSDWAREDVAAVAGPHLSGVRVPKVQSRGDVERVAQWLADSGCAAQIHCLLESALGVERAFEIAGAHAAVASVSLGEADLRADLGVRVDAGLDWARGRIVVAARAAGLVPPVQSVYTDVGDIDGLRETTRHARSTGFFGRSCVHPSQLLVVNDAFTPSAEEIADARRLVEALTGDDGAGAALLPDGRFVDRAVVQSARRTLALAEALDKEMV
jgi:citrate lyase subunit beta/citryl-CoA lyase